MVDNESHPKEPLIIQNPEMIESKPTRVPLFCQNIAVFSDFHELKTIMWKNSLKYHCSPIIIKTKDPKQGITTTVTITGELEQIFLASTEIAKFVVDNNLKYDFLPMQKKKFDQEEDNYDSLLEETAPKLQKKNSSGNFFF